MITKLREVDDRLVAAEGPRFDLDKIIPLAMKVLRVIVGRTMMRYPHADPPTYIHLETEARWPFTEDSYPAVAAGFQGVKATYDVADFSYRVEIGPFHVDLSLMGWQILHGPTVNCVTSLDENWADLDPTPVLAVWAKEGFGEPLVESLSYLESILESFRKDGLEKEAWYEDGVCRTVFLRFPHEVFGAGRGWINIQRELERREYETCDVREDVP